MIFCVLSSLLKCLSFSDAVVPSSNISSSLADGHELATVVQISMFSFCRDDVVSHTCLHHADCHSRSHFCSRTGTSHDAQLDDHAACAHPYRALPICPARHRWRGGPSTAVGEHHRGRWRQRRGGGTASVEAVEQRTEGVPTEPLPHAWRWLHGHRGLVPTCRARSPLVRPRFGQNTRPVPRRHLRTQSRRRYRRLQATNTQHIKGLVCPRFLLPLTTQCKLKDHGWALDRVHTSRRPLDRFKYVLAVTLTFDLLIPKSISPVWTVSRLMGSFVFELSSGQTNCLLYSPYSENPGSAIDWYHKELARGYEY